MERFRVVIVDDDDVSLENLDFSLRKDTRFQVEGVARTGSRERRSSPKYVPTCCSWM